MVSKIHNTFWESILREQCSYMRSIGQVWSNHPHSDKAAVIVEPRSTHPMLEPVIRNAMSALGAGWNLHVFTHDIHYVRSLFPNCEFTITRLSLPSITPNDYSRLLMQHGFWETIQSEHIVIFQTDVVFLRHLPLKYTVYDYAGANYYNPNHVSPRTGGIQGGFSVRKRSAMLECLSRVNLLQACAYLGGVAAETNFIPEDVYFTIACDLLKKHVLDQGLRRFLAIETENYDEPVAFHGFRYPYFPIQQCYELVQKSPLLCRYLKHTDVM
jgi:hypothetical protein